MLQGSEPEIADHYWDATRHHLDIVTQHTAAVKLTVAELQGTLQVA